MTVNEIVRAKIKDEAIIELDIQLAVMEVEEVIKQYCNMVYSFLRNMWIMKRLDEQYLTQMVTLKRITEEERKMILATPQMVRR